MTFPVVSESYAPRRIGMILDQPFPPDARVEREAQALIEAGYEVHLLCLLPEGSNLSREEHCNGLWVHRVSPHDVSWKIPVLGVQTRFPYKGIFKNMCRSLWNLDTAWYSLMIRFVEQYRIEALHVHDLRLLSTALIVAEHKDVAVVSDLHENYPVLMEMLKGKHNKRRGTRQRYRWEQIEKRDTFKADHVITVAEESRDRIIFHGVPPYQVSVLPNTVDVTKFQDAPIDPQVIKRFKSRFLLTYVGHINAPHRGIHTLLEAVAMLKGQIPEIFFVGAGGFRDDYFDQLQAIIHSHQLESHVDFTGWLDEMDFVSYIQASDICIVPHTANEHTNSGTPNKLYLYHMFGKPVIGSNCKPLQRYLEDTQGGLVFESGNPADLADKILTMYQQMDLRKLMGENGRQAVNSTYNWSKTAQTLVQIYQNLLPQGEPPRPYGGQANPLDQAALAQAQANS